jgi:hypothetical protein
MTYVPKCDLCREPITNTQTEYWHGCHVSCARAVVEVAILKKVDAANRASGLPLFR